MSTAVLSGGGAGRIAEGAEQGPMVGEVIKIEDYRLLVENGPTPCYGVRAMGFMEGMADELGDDEEEEEEEEEPEEGEEKKPKAEKPPDPLMTVDEAEQALSIKRRRVAAAAAAAACSAHSSLLSGARICSRWRCDCRVD